MRFFMMIIKYIIDLEDGMFNYVTSIEVRLI